MPFIINRFSDGISLIQESGVANFMRCNIWLVRGRDRDLVIDTGMGLESLKERITRETDRPLAAVTTHAHFDHIAGLHEFDERLGHRSEAEIYAAPTQATTVYAGAWKQITIVDPTVHPAFEPMTFTVTPAPLTGYLDDGDVLDLGDRAFQILHLPGHSPGSIGLLDRDARVLFSGDAIYDGELLDNLYHSDPVVYRKTLRRVAATDAEVFHAGHFPSFGRRRMSELVTAYLDGENTITDVVEWYKQCCRGNRDIFSEQDWSGAPMA